MGFNSLPPPPSMLSTVTMLPYAGGGDLGVAHGADVGARRAAAGFRVRPPLAPGSAAFTGAMATATFSFIIRAMHPSFTTERGRS